MREQRASLVTAYPSMGGDVPAASQVEPLGMVKAMAVSSMLLMDYAGPLEPLRLGRLWSRQGMTSMGPNPCQPEWKLYLGP